MPHVFATCHEMQKISKCFVCATAHDKKVYINFVRKYI